MDDEKLLSLVKKQRAESPKPKFRTEELSKEEEGKRKLSCTTLLVGFIPRADIKIISNDITIHKRTERVDEMARRARLEKSSQTGNLEKPGDRVRRRRFDVRGEYF